MTAFVAAAVLAREPVLAAGAGSAAGPLGLVVILLLGVATVLLIRNMDKRLRRLPREFADPPGGAPGPELPGPRRGPDDPEAR